MKRLLRIGFLTVGLGIFAGPIDVHDFADPGLETRYRALIAELRCPQCLNTNLAGSDAPTAKDLRAAVARLLNEGKSDADILKYLRDRYGEFVLYDPPFEPSTYVLWLLPITLLLVGGVIVIRVVRGSREPVPLNDSERARIDALLNEGLNEGLGEELSEDSGLNNS